MTDQNKQGPLQIGDKFLNKYEVRGLLGRGGYAYVYECADLFLGRSVALKIFKPVTSGPTDVERQAQKEARALLLVSDQRLVKLIDAGTHDGLVYLVMEKLNGRTLRDALRDVGRLTAVEALLVLLQVAHALAAAHRAGVIHRDIKPENIFVEAEMTVKVLDLGIAKVQGLGAQTTHKDGLRGTVLYMAPEQLQGHGVTPRSDIYALGVVGFELLFRHPLYLGDAPPAYEEAAWRQISFVPPMLDELDPTIPHDLAKVIRRMLLKSPEQRLASMEQVIEALGAVLSRLSHEAPQGKLMTRHLHEPLPQHAKRAAASLPPVHATMTDVIPAELVSGRRITDPSAAPLAFASSKPASGSYGARSAPLPSVQPSTPPPVAATVAKRAVAKPPPFFKDPAIRLAGTAAIVLGVAGGTYYGATHFLRRAEATAALPSAAPLRIEPATATPHAVPTVKAPAPDVAPAEAPRPAAPPPALPPASAPSAAVAARPAPLPTPARPTTQRPAPVVTPARPTNDPLMPSDEEIKRRMRALQGNPQPTPTAAPAPRQPPRGAIF